MDTLPSRPRSARTILFMGVAFDLVATGIVFLQFYVRGSSACAYDALSTFCYAQTSTFGWLPAVVLVCSLLPLVSLAGSQPAIVGMLSQDLLLFLSVWLLVDWNFLPLLLAVFGGLLGEWGCSLLYRKGASTPPVGTTMLGASWAGLVALWTVLLVLFQNLSPPFSYHSGPPSLNGPSGLMPLLTPLDAADWLVPALILTTALALAPVSRPRAWWAGLIGSLGVITIGILMLPYFPSLTGLAMLAGVALGVGGGGYVKYNSSGRSLGQIIEGVPPPPPGWVGMDGRAYRESTSATK